MIRADARTAVSELLAAARMREGDVMVIGCSTSEIGGADVGTMSDMDIAQSVFDGVYPVLKENGIYIAAQCCEHLNRALIVESELAERLMLPIVNVIPQKKAGGSFATVAYNSLERPCAVENISAGAGMDIGGVLIGMHLRSVAVPVRVSVKNIGKAVLLCARTRPKFVGGSRAVYDESLM